MLVTLVMMVVAVAAEPSAANNATLLWCSDPVRPNETIVVQYAYASQLQLASTTLVDATVHLAPVSSGTTVSLTPSQVTPHSLAFVVPADFPVDAYEISVTHGAGGGSQSNSILANQPSVWWVQGDGGEFATAGGWLRAFGHGLALPLAAAHNSAGDSSIDPEPRPHLELRDLARRLTAAAQSADWHAAEGIAQEAAGLVSRQRETTDGALATTLMLTPQTAGGASIPRNQHLPGVRRDFSDPDWCGSGHVQCLGFEWRGERRAGLVLQPSPPTGEHCRNQASSSDCVGCKSGEGRRLSVGRIIDKLQ